MKSLKILIIHLLFVHSLILTMDQVIDNPILENVMDFLDAGRDINSKNIFDDTLLCQAVFYNRNDIVDLLLTLPNIDINAYNGHGCTALLLASLEHVSDEIFAMLVQRRPDIDVSLVVMPGRFYRHPDYEGKTALSIVVENQNVNKIRALMNSGHELDPQYEIAVLQEKKNAGNFSDQEEEILGILQGAPLW